MFWALLFSLGHLEQYMPMKTLLTCYSSKHALHVHALYIERLPFSQLKIEAVIL